MCGVVLRALFLDAHRSAVLINPAWEDRRVAGLLGFSALTLGCKGVQLVDALRMDPVPERLF